MHSACYDVGRINGSRVHSGESKEGPMQILLGRLIMDEEWEKPADTNGSYRESAIEVGTLR